MTVSKLEWRRADENERGSEANEDEWPLSCQQRGQQRAWFVCQTAFFVKLERYLDTKKTEMKGWVQDWSLMELTTGRRPGAGSTCEAGEFLAKRGERCDRLGILKR